ncbi:hypothetical protein [Blastochloris tepida]|uniref:hypothetical protein n=1 Tax=Blastochloris tepida TaxID=2233851 RepID=UPI000F81C27F|nr:hypothetical protein [Blastochloris tepida]
MLVLAVASVLGACVHERVAFQAGPDQQSITRDGQPAIVSRRKSSIVLVRAAAREFAAGARPVFVVGINNLTKQPLEFRVADIEAYQRAESSEAALKVFTFEDLRTEERNRQVAAAILTGLAAGANAAAAANAGYYNANTTVYTPRGVYQAHTVGYSPAAAAVAQANANMQNEAMISATIERGQANMVALERGVIKDNTLLPGEWYGGQVHIQPPEGSDQKSYRLVVVVGSDRHEISIAQQPTR